MNDNMIVGLIVTLVLSLSFIFVTINGVMKYKLKKEQIKADTLLKTEEIRAKNQLDIEKLIIQDKANTVQSVNYVETNSIQDEALSERRNRLNERM